jgi:hypothetical protein
LCGSGFIGEGGIFDDGVQGRDECCCVGVGFPFVGACCIFRDVFAFYPFVEGLGGLGGSWLVGCG